MGDKAKKWVEVISRNAKTSLRLIADILDMERFAEGKLELQMAQFDMQDLIEESVESFSSAAAEHRISLRALPSGNSSSLFIGDRDRIEQVYQILSETP